MSRLPEFPTWSRRCPIRLGGPAAFAACIVTFAGCAALKPPVKETRPADTADVQASPTSASPNPFFDRPAQRLTVEFTVHRISAPKGNFTTDEGIWKLVTGPLPSAEMTLRLAANGFRAVVGRESDRAALLAELTKLPEQRIALDHAMPDATKLVELELGAVMPRLALFHYDEAGSMHGCDFIDAKARFKMAYELRPANLQEVILEVVPEMEEPPGPRRWVKPPDGPPREEEEERKTTFADLAFSARIPQGGFLMLGPTPTIHDQPVLARPFFVEELQSPSEAKVETRESIYVISPIVRAYAPQRPPAARDPGVPVAGPP